MRYRASPVPVIGIRHSYWRIRLLVLKMRLHECLLSHLLDLHIVVGSNTANRDDESSQVDGGKWILEYEVCRSNRNDFLEDAANAKGNDRSALQQSKFGRSHEEGEDTREQENAKTESSAFGFKQVCQAFSHGGEAFDGYRENENAGKHDGRQEEDGGEGVCGCGVAQEEDLSQRPAESGGAG